MWPLPTEKRILDPLQASVTGLSGTAEPVAVGLHEAALDLLCYEKYQITPGHP